jgi:hypothetical protein
MKQGAREGMGRRRIGRALSIDKCHLFIRPTTIGAKENLASIHSFYPLKTALNHLWANASCAVSLLAGSEFVNPPIRSLKSASTFFHREKSLHR